MKTAKKLFESRMEFLMAANDRDTADKDSVYIDYIFKLEQELHDNELRRKDLLTSLQRANAQKAELEQEKAELVEALRLIKHKLETDPAITDTIWIDDNPMCSETAVDRINDLLGIDE